MTDFDYDVMVRKKLARQAKYRKCGSKSKKCSLSTDHMTHKQWKEKCGEIMTYQLQEPITWDKFKKYPAHIQKLYMEHLIDTYYVNATDLAKMFGVNPATVRRYCAEVGLSGHFSRGKRMSQEQKDAFAHFLAGDIDVPHNEGAEPNVPDQLKDHFYEIKQGVVSEPVAACEQTTGMAMTSFMLQFSGKFSRDMIFNSLSHMLPDDADVNIEIRCSIQQDE